MTTDWQKLDQHYFMTTYKRLPVTIVKGEGARVWDDRGREYLDFTAGVAVNNLGHCHPVVVDAIIEQAKTLIHCSNWFYSIPQVQLGCLLVEHSCLDQVFFCNSGAEANEGAVKLARRYGAAHRDGAYEVITTLDSFHGRTLAMVAATGKPLFQEPYRPLPEGFRNVPWNDIGAIKAATSERTCAVMLEPIQGEGGVNLPAAGYLEEVRRWCDANNLLLILDEVQTGLGRTGTLFAYEQYGVEPDIMTLAKALGGGLAIGAFLAKAKVAMFQPGDHGSTFGGNPVACAAGYASLRYMLEHDIAGHAKRIGTYFQERLRALQANYPFIREARGAGLILAMEFSEELSAELVDLCIQRGLLLNAVKPTALRFIPPLIVTEQEVDQAIRILNDTLLIVDERLKVKARAL